MKFLPNGAFEKQTEPFAVLVLLLVTLWVVTFPLQDFDTFWHLAYGRAMVEQGTFVNHEIFSYTAAGKYLGSHSQLAQVILYLVWAAGGANILLAFKLLMAALTFWLIVRTAGECGGSAMNGAVLAAAALFAGMGRIVERPELFSIVFQALLIWLLLKARRTGYVGRELWWIPPVMVAWDYLHGSVYGLAVLGTFVTVEVLRLHVFMKRRILLPVDVGPPGHIKPLLMWSAITLGSMTLHPNGLLNYSHILRIGSSDEYRMYGEFMPPAWSIEFIPYWVFLAATLIIVATQWRRCDLTTLALLIPFLVLSLMYRRAMLAFCLAAIPATVQSLVSIAEKFKGRSGGRAFAALLICLLLAGSLLYKQRFAIELFRFGFGVNANVFPVGSTRFVNEVGLPGNMYNRNNFGGYLAFFLRPEYKIFHYNQPGVFTALFDFLHKPASRRDWPIDYAVVGDSLEFKMFEREGFVTVYQEPTAAVMVRNDARNAALIERYRVRRFGPLLSDEQLLARARHPAAAQRLLVEMADYLTFRQDRRIADLFGQLLSQSPALFAEEEKAALLERVKRYNPAAP